MKRLILILLLCTAVKAQEYQPFLIAPFRTGKSIGLEPWLSPQDAFPTLINARVNKGVLEKRRGYQLFATMKHGGVEQSATTIMGIHTYMKNAMPQLLVFDTTNVNRYNVATGELVDLRPVSGALGIDNTYYQASNGSSGYDALNGDAAWTASSLTPTPYLIMDLGQKQTVISVSGRSNSATDPTSVDVYVSDSLTDWGTAVSSAVSTWQDTDDFVTIDTTDKDGRYVKVEVNTTESTTMSWGGSAAPYTVDANCMAIWNMESGALTTDSKGTNTLTNSGVTADTAGEPQGSAWGLFTRSESDYMTITDTNLDTDYPLKSGEVQKSWTKVFWVELNTVDVTEYQTIYNKGYGAADKSINIVVNSDNKVEVFLSSDGTLWDNSFSHGSALSVDNLYHVTVTYDETNGAYRIRIWDEDGSAILGTDATGNTVSTYISNAAVTLGTPRSSSDLESVRIAHWKLNEDAANTTILDDDATSHDGTTLSANTEDVTATGKVSKCIDIDFTSYIRITNDHDELSFGNGTNDSAFSISAWIYVYDGHSEKAIINKYDATAGAEKREWRFFYTSAEKIAFRIYDESAEGNVNIWKLASNAMSLGWRHVVMTYDGTGGENAADGITLYVDNVVVATTNNTDASYISMDNTTSIVRIGAMLYLDGNHYDFFGEKLDNIALFNTEITSTQIAALWNGGNGTEDFVLSYAPDGNLDEVVIWNDALTVTEIDLVRNGDYDDATNYSILDVTTRFSGFTGGNDDFFSFVNWLGVGYFTNNIDQIYTYSGSGVIEPFNIRIDSAGELNHVQTCRYIFVKNDRLLLLDVVEHGNWLPQRCRFSPVLSTDFSIAGGGYVDAPTEDRVVSAGWIGKDIVVFFRGKYSGSLWKLRTTGNTDLPFRWEKVSDTLASQAPYAAVEFSDGIAVISLNNIIFYDGFRVKYLDLANIRDIVDDFDQSKLKYSTALHAVEDQHVYFTYTTLGESYPNRILDYNILEQNWSVYKYDVHVLGTFDDQDVPIWTDIDIAYTGIQGDLISSMDFDVRDILGDPFPFTLMGTRESTIYKLNTGNYDGTNDSSGTIDIDIQSSRWNPFIVQNQQARLGKMLFLVDNDEEASFMVSYYKDMRSTAWTTRTVSCDSDDDGADKFWVTTNLNGEMGNFHRIKISHDERNNRPRIHAIMPFFMPGGELDFE